MRWVSVVLFLVIVIFGAVRFGSSADLNAKQAQTKVQALREMQRPLPAGRADSHHVVDPVATQEAEQANQSAQQNVATFQIIQIILTFLAVVLTVFIIYLILAGKQVDKVVKGFTLWVYDEHHRLFGSMFRSSGIVLPRQRRFFNRSHNSLSLHAPQEVQRQYCRVRDRVAIRLSRR